VIPSNDEAIVDVRMYDDEIGRDRTRSGRTRVLDVLAHTLYIYIGTWDIRVALNYESRHRLFDQREMPRNSDRLVATRQLASDSTDSSDHG